MKNMKSTLLILSGLALLSANKAEADVATIWGGADTPAACAPNAAGVISCTGGFSNNGTPTPEDAFTYTFTTLAPETLTIQTYGFGGGTNAAGTVINPGGFDSLVSLFSGPANNATILIDTGGNPIASADDLINTNTGLPQFSPGCGPAGTVTIGSGQTAQNICGDSMLTVSLQSAGTYTLLLTDSGFEAAPIATGNLSTPVDLTDTVNNYGDLTGGVFQTCDTNGDCVNDSANFAVDISGVAPAAVPEQSPLPLFGIVLAGLAFSRKRGLLVRS